MGILNCLAGSALILVTLGGCAAVEEPPAASDSGFEDRAWDEVLGRFPDAVRPEAQFVRFVTPDNWGTTRATCLTEAGLPTEAAEDGGISMVIPDGQAEAIEIASYVCEVKFPMDPKYNVPHGDAQLEVLYRYFNDELVPCLATQGYDAGPVPTLQSFKETYDTEEAWTPYMIIGPTVPHADLPSLENACPQNAPDLYE